MPGATAAPAGAPPLAVSVASLRDASAQVPDPRRAQGRRFALPAILPLAVAAILATHLTAQASAEWGADQSPAVQRALGFPKGATPHQPPSQRLFRRLDPAPLAAALTGHFDPPGAPEARPRSGQGVAGAGKAQRGRLPFETPARCPVHALTAFGHDRGVGLAQEAIRRTAEQAEVPVASARVARRAWRERVLTGAALLCQRHLCAQVRAAGGAALLVGEGNQPPLQEDLPLLFAPPADHAAPPPLPDRRAAETGVRGHGRIERRRLVASTDLTGDLDWPGAAQGFRLERTWREQGRDKRAGHSGITSLPPAAAAAPQLLRHRRGHWGSENRLHYVKDGVLGEDRSLLHQGPGRASWPSCATPPCILLRLAGHRRSAARLRQRSRHPEAVLPRLALALP